MSSLEMRSHGALLFVDLETRLRLIGIKVPDQSKIPSMMEATRIGLPPMVPQWRRKIAWYRWLTRLDSIYEVFSYDEFVTLDDKFNRKANSWGGLPPDAVARNVETIGKLIPDAQCFVHATFDDPWLEVRLEGESVFINCWMRTGGYGSPVTLHI